MNQLNHPLILAAQAVLIVGLFRLFFAVRHAHAPLPQLVGVGALVALADFTARIAQSEFFFVAEIGEYMVFSATVVTAIFSLLQQKADDAKRPGATVVIPDVFARWEGRLTWLSGVIVGILFVYSSLKTYQNQQKASADVVATATTVYAQATADYTRQQAASTDKQDSILTALSSISATQGTILANQSAGKQALLKSNADIKKQLSNKTKEIKTSIRSTVIDARPIETQKPKTVTPDEEPTFWQRFKNRINGKSVRRDTLSGHSPATDSTFALY